LDARARDRSTTCSDCRTEHVVARDPDVAFSGDGFGVVWAQRTDVDPPAEVWFAHARCEDDR
jgi:hypothetical protein